MAKFEKIPVVVDAMRWFKNGDHPEDACEKIDAGDGPFQGEGHVVRYYRRPECEGQSKCRHCGKVMHAHGWVDTLEHGHVVCPGDWIIRGIEGEYYPCKDSIFRKTYRAIDEAAEGRWTTVPEAATGATNSYEGILVIALNLVKSSVAGGIEPDLQACVDRARLLHSLTLAASHKMEEGDPAESPQPKTATGEAVQESIDMSRSVGNEDE